MGDLFDGSSTVGLVNASRYDTLLCLVSNVPAIPHDDSPEPALRMIPGQRPIDALPEPVHLGLATVADVPAVAVPAGTTTTSLPVGIQAVAPYLEDRIAIDVGRHIERVVGRLTRS